MFWNIWDPRRLTGRRTSATSNVYTRHGADKKASLACTVPKGPSEEDDGPLPNLISFTDPVLYINLRAHETKANLVCRLLIEKNKPLRICIEVSYEMSLLQI